MTAANESSTPGGLNEVRRLQLEILRAMTVEEKFRVADGMILLAMEARDARIRRQNPGCTAEKLGEIRNHEVLATCESFHGIVDANWCYRKGSRDRPAEETS